MPNLPLRDIPEQVHRDLKAAANRNHRSLNGEILARLSASVGPEAQEVDLEALLERIQQRHETIVRGHDETAEMATNENRDPVNAETRFKYDVCLSFAGEQREFVEQVAAKLKAHGIRVFFDDDEQVALWGKDLYAYLDDVYRHLCRYCIIFASKEYAAKMWTTHERQSAQARALRENREYILPARFDDTPIPGTSRHPSLHRPQRDTTGRARPPCNQEARFTPALAVRAPCCGPAVRAVRSR